MYDEPDASDGDYRIAIFDRPQTPHELSAVFQDVLNVHPTDAIVWSRHVPGVLNERFSESQSQALVKALAEIGLRALAVRQGDIPNLRQSLAVHHLELDHNGLRVINLHGTPDVSIPWPAIQMICVGEVPFEVSRRDPPGDWSGLSAGHHYQRPAIQVPLSPTFEVWIACVPPLPNLHIHHERMNYEYLGARRADSSTINFHQFMLDLTTRATNALLSDSTLAYLQHDQTEHYRFKSSESLLNDATLRTLLARQQSAESCAKTQLGDPQLVRGSSTTTDIDSVRDE